MDNLWTAMTGMQINPGTPSGFQSPASQRVDIARVVPALGVEQFFQIDPFDLDGSAATLQQALKLPGVKVILARRECAIQSVRHDPAKAADPGRRRELQPVQAVRDGDRLRGPQPGGDGGGDRRCALHRLRAVRGSVQPRSAGRHAVGQAGTGEALA